MHLGDILQRAFSKNHEKTALRDMASGKELTYTELEGEIRSVDRHLNSKGIGEDDSVSIIAGNSYETALFVLTCYYTGRTVIQINPRVEAEQLKYFMDDSGAEAIFAGEKMREKVEASDIESYHELDTVTEDNDGELSERTGFDDEDVAMISYTSGTTGLPKGVPFSHKNVYHSTLVLLIRDEIKEGGDLCLMYPIYHSPACLQIIAALMMGATVNIPAERNAEEALKTIEEVGATVIGGVPTQLKDIVEHEYIDDYDTSSLRYVHTGSGLMTQEIYDKVKAELCDTICTSYGSSEAGETMNSLKDSIAIGRPVPFHEVRIVEPEGDVDDAVRQGDSGELIVKGDGPQIFNGYLNQPEKTAEVMDSGWYRTGDIVREDEEGEVWFQGRKDDMIVSGGENISPGNVENMLLAHPEVRNAGVIGVKDERWGQKVVGFVSGDVTREVLEKHAKNSELENFKRPKEYIIRDDLPVNETGGVERKKLREIYEEK